MKKLKKKIIVKILRELHFQPACYCFDKEFCNTMRNPILDRHGMYVKDFDGDYYFIGYENGKKSRRINIFTTASLNKMFPYISKAQRKKYDEDMQNAREHYPSF